MAGDLVLAIDLGGTKVLSCLVDGEGLVVASGKEKLDDARGPKRVLDKIKACAFEALDESGLRLDSVRGVGIAVPGAVDHREGIVIEAPNLGWRNFDVKRQVERAFGRPVVVENDVNAGLLGEAIYGVCRGCRQDVLAAFFVGTGVGGAIMVNGGLVRGTSGSAGEFGHMKIDKGGPECGCGRKGCLEALASRSAVERLVGKKSKTALKGGKRLTSKVLAAALRENDREVKQALEQAAKFLGIGVANVLNLLNPRMIVLGGGLMSALGWFLLPRIRKSARRHSFGVAFDDCEIELSGLGDYAVPLGVSALAAGKAK